MRDPYQAWENQELDEGVEFENGQIAYGEVIEAALRTLRDSDDHLGFAFRLKVVVGIVMRGNYPRDHTQMTIEALTDVARAAREVGKELGIYDPTCYRCGGTGMVLGSTGPTGDDPERPCERCDGRGGCDDQLLPGSNSGDSRGS